MALHGEMGIYRNIWMCDCLIVLFAHITIFE